MRRFARTFIVLGLTCSPYWAGLPSVQASPSGPWPRVGPGTEYYHERIGNAPWSIHIMKVSRSRATFQLGITLAQDHIYGLAPMTEQIENLGTSSGRPVAAINGDFFHIRPGPYQGDPLGLQIIGGELVSSPTGASFWVGKDGSLHMGEVEAEFQVTGPDGFVSPCGLNEKRQARAAVLYTPMIGDSTRTEGGLELLLEPVADSRWLPLQAGERYQARIAGIRTQGNTKLTPDVMVLSIGPDLAAEFPSLAEGQIVTLDLRTSPDLKGVAAALGGGPILLHKGKARNWEHRSERHPRTAVGWNREHLFLVVVDGRQEGLSIGMNYTELSSLMLRLGCTEAMNLDGGGSSTFWMGGYVINSPSDGRERPVANGLVVMSAEQTETP